MQDVSSASRPTSRLTGIDESAARKILLVRAAETGDAQLISAEDRGYADRAAAELARWSGKATDRARWPGKNSAQRSAATLFLTKRAELLAAKLTEREPALKRALRASVWRPWIGWVIVLTALVAGVALEAVADRKHVNILAFPLVALVLWNLATYAFMFIGAMRRMVGGSARSRWFTRSTIARMLDGRLVGGSVGATMSAFGAQWASQAAPLHSARAARILHVAAALLAIGALAGLYARGLLFEYRAGWESTFLSAATVEQILALFLGPASYVSAIVLPNAAALEGLMWSVNPTGENAARWIHLYALTVAGAVIVPRLLFAAIARWRESRLARNVPLALHDAYFLRLTSGWTSRSTDAYVFPYAHTLDAAASAALEREVRRVLGESMTVQLREVTSYGTQDSVVVKVPPNTQAALLFNLAATPESENHGAYIDKMRALKPVILIDQAAFKRKVGSEDRLTERRRAWEAFLQARNVSAEFVDLA